ncbi:MAG: hypothetical protein Crog4KO_11450 [Crocinitomicaceae bacterium]
MLTGKDIGQLIEKPESISVDQLDAIAELTVKYPYSQLFSVLYLKGMHSSASLDFEAALKEHSYRVSDRAQLFELIHNHDASTPSVQSSIVDQSENDTSKLRQAQLSETSASIDEEDGHLDRLDDHDKTKKEIKEPLETSSSSAKQKSDDQSEMDVSDTPAPHEEESFALNTEEFLESESEILQVSEPQENYVSAESEEESDDALEESDLLPIDPPNDALEENILHHVHAVQYQLDALTPEEEAALDQKTLESQSEEHDTIEDGDTATSGQTQPEESESEETGLSFTGWLHANINFEEKEDEQASIKAVVEDFSAFDPLESMSGDVEKPKQEFFSPTKKAKESLNESQLPVSETLAKVYAVQGNYPKAIAAYKELILAFPEKKSFFADQIEDLQKKLNS